MPLCISNLDFTSECPKSLMAFPTWFLGREPGYLQLHVGNNFLQNKGQSKKFKENFLQLFSRSELICAWGEEGAVSIGTDHIVHSSPAFPPDLLPGETMDTLAAGDTFNAAYIRSRTQGHSLTEALDFACIVAGAKCGMKGIDGLTKFKTPQN